jgi:hypothetical protein
MNELKKIVLVSLLFIGSNICFAQELSIRGGLNLSKFVTKEGEEVVYYGNTFNPGFNIGPILELPLKNVFSLETGIIFTSKGDKITGENRYLRTENMYYLDIPILLKVTIPVRETKICIMAGGYGGSALFGNRYGEGIYNSVFERGRTNIQWGNKLNEYNRLDYGLNFGTGFKIQKFQIGALYKHGLNNVRNDAPWKTNNRTIEFYIAYQIKNFKKLKQSL